MSQLKGRLARVSVATPMAVQTVRTARALRGAVRRAGLAGAAPWATHVVGTARILKARAVQFAGQYYSYNYSAKITGYTLVAGQPGTKRVRILERDSSKLVREVRSRAVDGYFEFVHLNPAYTYVAVGFDDSPGVYQAEVADKLVPE